MSIKANELRIGNIVNSGQLSIPRMGIRTNGWMKITAYGIHNAEAGIITDLEPIPLTPEILQKCGFEKVDHINGYTFYCHDKSKLSIYDNKTEWGGRYVDQHCKHLHQLQNLYFALTGTELTIPTL